MVAAACPGHFFWSCSTTDFFIELGLIIVIISCIVMLCLFMYLRSKWGGIFYHSQNSNIGMEFQHEGEVTAFHLKNFGAMKVVTTGEKKDTLIIPRMGASFKSKDSPIMSIILGRGLGLQVNPFLSPYIERLGGAWPEWSGTPPPAKPKDLRQFYTMFAEWKAKGEKHGAEDKARYTLSRLAATEVPASLTGEDLKQWTADRKAEYDDEYEQGAWGPFTAMLGNLKDPNVEDRIRYGIYEALNAAIQSEPAELWPTWIAGQVVDARDLARWAEPVPASELDSIIAKVERALKKGLGPDVIKIIAILAGIAMLMVGMGVAYKLVAG